MLTLIFGFQKGIFLKCTLLGPQLIRLVLVWDLLNSLQALASRGLDKRLALNDRSQLTESAPESALFLSSDDWPVACATYRGSRSRRPAAEPAGRRLCAGYSAWAPADCQACIPASEGQLVQE